MPIRFAINRMSAPRMPFARFAAMVQALGASAIEIRNDLAGVEIEDGTAPTEVGRVARDHGLQIRSINALQRFEQFDAARADEARALADYAQACGAQALVLCPTNSLRDPRDAARRHADLVHALTQLDPILRERGLVGLIEPLGFEECAVRRKAQAVQALQEVGEGAPFALVHDTFHHHLAGDPQIFAALTGLVHVSGVEDAALAPAQMRDGHRVLVGAADRLGNVDQLAHLHAAGYAGWVSFEPFADVIAQADDIQARLAQSMQYLARSVADRLAAG